MNPEIKKLWVEALRSGDYKKGKNQLRSGSKFCCLGVLCNLHAQAHPEIAALESDKSVYLGNSMILPNEVVKWSGIYTQIVTYRGQTMSLSEVNDNTRATFETIAKIIERQL
jgi:hypothetical protein